jgi:Tfp pilus assembly protein FimV
VQGGSQAVQGGSQAVQGGSQAVQGGSQAVQGGSQAVQGGSQAVQGGSLKNFFRSRSLPRSERERRAEDERRRRAEAAVLPKPERRLARQAGRGALLTQRDGSLFPLYTDTRTFGE